MVKTNESSWFALKSLEEIRSTTDVILQIEQTGTKFAESGKGVYLCEIVGAHAYRAAGTVGKLSGELIAVNEENRRLRRKIDRLEAELRKERAKTATKSD